MRTRISPPIGRHEPEPDSTDPLQANVFDAPRARSKNPETSKLAAASVRNVRASHQRVLAMFRHYGDMTDETLATLLDESGRSTGFKTMSPSGVRSRRSELSKPNMDRLDEIAYDYSEKGARVIVDGLFVKMDEPSQNRARHQLRTEGFRSPLWDTGKREKLASGRLAIVWGVAR